MVTKGKLHVTKFFLEKPGIAYVYFIYGLYYRLNIVTEKIGIPHAVLIRAIQPVEGVEIMQKHRGTDKNLVNGPAKLCKALAIDKSFNGWETSASHRYRFYIFSICQLKLDLQ